MTTSPRTPEKMIPEIELLHKHFAGQEWTPDVQRAFMEVLRAEDFFNGKGENDAAFSARDRINRAPKSLGFVRLSPTITLTPAGEALISSKRKDEVFLRQMLKFQIPSPYHRPTKKARNFCIKPYLEMLRLVRTMGTLRFDELRLFGLQLTDWHDFGSIVAKIEKFRKDRLEHKGSYRTFFGEYSKKELSRIYAEQIAKGETKTRESHDTSIEAFIKTQTRNLRDYADACFRYLRATGLVNVSHIGKSLSIVTEKLEDVDFILENTEREPAVFENEDIYAAYLGNARTPSLYTDNKERLLKRIHDNFPDCKTDDNWNVETLKNLLAERLESRKEENIRQQVADIKNYKLYDDIQETYQQISDDSLYDAPLVLEWNTWRAMTMLDGGDIKTNLKFDDFGIPLSTAQGNMADIVCDYGDFMLTVEVTMASGQRQYEMESEPVSRHLGKLKTNTSKQCYCLFVAPTINDACVAHFFALQHLNIAFYGGTSTIVPLPLDVFRKMLEDSYKADYTPNPSHIRHFFEKTIEIAYNGCNEKQWFEEVKKEAICWLG